MTKIKEKKADGERKEKCKKEVKTGKLYHYTECGLSNVYLENGFNVLKTPYGDAVSVDNVHELHKVVAQYLITNKQKLSGEEFRFLRIELDMSQKKLGFLMGVSDQTIASWEKDKIEIQAYGDIFIRVIYREFFGGNADMIRLVEHLKELDRKENENKLVFQETKGGWISKKAA